MRGLKGRLCDSQCKQQAKEKMSKKPALKRRPRGSWRAVRLVMCRQGTPATNPLKHSNTTKDPQAASEGWSVETQTEEVKHQVSKHETQVICFAFMHSVPFNQNASLKRAGIIMFCSFRSLPGT